MIYKTLQGKQKNEQYELHYKRGWTQVLRKGYQFLFH
jgi:hypothetical protein